MTFKSAGGKVFLSSFFLSLLHPRLPHQQIRLCSLPAHATINSLVRKDEANWKWGWLAPFGAWPEAGGVDILLEGEAEGKSWHQFCFVSHLQVRSKGIFGNTFPQHDLRPPTLIMKLLQASWQPGLRLTLWHQNNETITKVRQQNHLNSWESGRIITTVKNIIKMFIAS